MIQSTLKTVLTDRLWEQAQARESRYIAAQEAARTLTEQVAEVTATYDFARDEANCFFLADGTAVQMAMRLTHKLTGRAVSVVCKLDDCGDNFWFILDMANAPYEAAVYIAAVQARLENNRSKTCGRAN